MSDEKKPKSKKRINIGAQGQTPKKQISYSIYDAPSQVPKATPQRGYNEPPKSALAASSKVKSTSEDGLDGHFDANGSPIGNKYDAPVISKRPKTSRGKSCPSPDEFYDYVIPSPNKISMDLNKQKVFSDSGFPVENVSGPFPQPMFPTSANSKMPPLPPTREEEEEEYQNMRGIKLMDGSDSSDSDSVEELGRVDCGNERPKTSRGGGRGRPHTEPQTLIIDPSFGTSSETECSVASAEDTGSMEDSSNKVSSDESLPGSVQSSELDYESSSNTSRTSGTGSDANVRMLACWLFSCAMKA